MSVSWEMEKNEPHERQETVNAKSLFIIPRLSHITISAMQNLHNWASKEFWFQKFTKQDIECRTWAIITRGLYIFYPIFHCRLYCRVVNISWYKGPYFKEFCSIVFDRLGL